MEKKLFNLLVILFVSAQLMSQADDLQWLILNYTGKDGVNPGNSAENNYVNPFNANTDFFLDGITHPNTAVYSRNKNDLFIIYNDGTFYSSRVKDPNNINPGFFYSNNLKITKHYFTNVEANKIQYLYLTNIYEDDDIPPGVKAKAEDIPGVINGFDSFLIPADSETSPKEIFANHDVVLNKDITLILDTAKILQAAHAANITTGTNFQFEVFFDTIRRKSDHQTFPGNFFAPSPVFHASNGPDIAMYPNQGVSFNNNLAKATITLGSAEYIYLNLRPTTSVNNYMPGINGIPSHEAVFTVKTVGPGATEFAHLNEDIRSAHDPNSVRILSICTDKAGNYIVTCRLMFVNTSNTSPGEIYTMFKLPAIAEKNCLEIIEWNIAGNKVSGNVEFPSGKVKCTFKKNGNLQKCPVTSPDKTSCSGYILFKYKIGSNNNVANVQTQILPTSAVVFFNDKPFIVQDYYDLIDPDKFSYGGSITHSSRPILKGGRCSINCKGY